MSRPEIIVCRSDKWNCFFVSTDDGTSYIDPSDPIAHDFGVAWLSPKDLPLDTRVVWRSGDQS